MSGVIMDKEIMVGKRKKKKFIGFGISCLDFLSHRLCCI